VTSGASVVGSKTQAGFAEKVVSAGTEPLAVASGIKTRPTIMTEQALWSVIKTQSKSRFSA